MLASEITVNGVYIAKVSGKLTKVRVDAIEQSPTIHRDPYTALYSRGNRTVYRVTNLATGRETTFKSAAKLRRPA